MYYAETKIFNEKSCKIERLGPFENFNEIFRKIGFENIVQNIEVRPKFLFNEYLYTNVIRTTNEKKYRIVNENGIILSRASILGEYRKWINERTSYWHQKWLKRRNGQTKSAYGRFRHPKTLNELKAIFSLDEDDKFYGAKIRSKRGKSYLPTVWDDVYSNNEKCWKTQSKRKKQWKYK